MTNVLCSVCFLLSPVWAPGQRGGMGAAQTRTGAEKRGVKMMTVTMIQQENVALLPCQNG